MIDLQRVIACLSVHEESSSEAKVSVNYRYLSNVSKSSFSQKLLNAMGAQVEWRQGLIIISLTH